MRVLNADFEGSDGGLRKTNRGSVCGPVTRRGIFNVPNWFSAQQLTNLLPLVEVTHSPYVHLATNVIEPEEQSHLNQASALADSRTST